MFAQREAQTLMNVFSRSFSPQPFFYFCFSLFVFHLCSSVFICGSFLLAAPQEGPADLIVVGGTIVTMDGERRVIEDGAIVVRGDRIVTLGPREALEKRFRARKRIDARGRIILPGLINAHTHAPMSLLRGVADDLALQEWLEEFIFPAEARNVTREFVEWGTRLALAEMIRSGTTTYADMYYFEDDIARVTQAAGVRGVLGETLLDFPAPDNKTHEQALAYTEAYLKRWQGDPLIRAAVAPHAIYTNSEASLRRAFELARRYRAPVLIHLAETKREAEETRAKHGVSPVGYLEKLGLLDADVVAKHCVWVDAADMAILARRGAGCVHNPSSNMKLASGVAPVVEMLAAGVRVGLGTDGPAGSNNDSNLFEEIDLAAKLQKVTRMDPRALPAVEAIALATIGGARALQMEKEIGSLETGKKADFILLRTDAPHAVPCYDVYSLIAYSLKASDVETVVIAGRVVMENRRLLTLDEAQVLTKAREFAEKVKASLREEKIRN
jgi:5-methylthioadenosine/S-adenosylhomocysteine deaminase